MKTVLTIAGSDCSGGAGIQADIKTMTVHKTYAMSVITALTAQNTMGVHGILEVSPDFVAKQLDDIFTDIYPDAIKIGMVASTKIIQVIANKLIEYKASNIVVDPVMVATSGDPLIEVDAMQALIEKLIPLGTVITPNVPEAEKLCGFKITSKEKMIKAGHQISKDINGAVLVKGGHFDKDANDLLIHEGKEIWLNGKRFNNANTHGTGCTLSSAIASNLAKGYTIIESVHHAKAYISGAIEANLNLGNGRGPLNHMYK